MKHRTVTVAEFEARCVALLDEVEQHGGRITITRDGRPLATVEPAAGDRFVSPEGRWAGRMEVADDLEAYDSSHLWDASRKTGAEI